MGDKRKVMVCTASRAERGLLEPIIKRIRSHPTLELSLIELPTAANIDELSEVMTHVYQRIKHEQPSLILVPTDRMEMVGAALAAFYSNVPLFHFLGGARGSGTHDDIVRHLISMLAHIIFCESDEGKRRLELMGVESWRIIVSGTTHFDDLEIDESLVPNRPYDLVLMHPVTVFPEKSKEEIKKVFGMLDGERLAVVLYPNDDLGREFIVEEIERHRGDPNVTIIKDDLPRNQFLGLLKKCGTFFSNSSATLYEAPYFGVRVVNPSIRNAEREFVEARLGASDVIVDVLASIPLGEKLLRKRIGYG